MSHRLLVFVDLRHNSESWRLRDVVESRYGRQACDISRWCAHGKLFCCVEIVI